MNFLPPQLHTDYRTLFFDIKIYWNPFVVKQQEKNLEMKNIYLQAL